MEDQTKKDILWATANKFFPNWEITTGLTPNPWVIVKRGTTILELHVPKTISLDKFEEEAWWQFKRLRDDFEIAQVGNGE
jgi:hypothetical protein